jgi:ABC-type sulfate transport system permease component
VQNLNYAAANTTALVLIVIAFLLLSLVYSMNRRFWSLGPRP